LSGSFLVVAAMELVQVVTAWILEHHVEARHWTTGLPALFCCKAARWLSSSLKSGMVHKWLMAKKNGLWLTKWNGYGFNIGIGYILTWLWKCNGSYLEQFMFFVEI